MRLFIAIPLQKDIQRSIHAYSARLQECSTAGRFVPQDNYHITLHFFGDTDELFAITDAMHQTVKDAKPFLLHLGDYGYFTHGGARTSFLKVTGELDELYRIYTILESSLWERGFAKGKGRLQPHITLARSVEHGNIDALKPPKDGFRVNSIVLFESRNERGRPVYNPLHTERF